MSTMKHVCFALALSVGAAAPAFAQNTQHPTDPSTMNGDVQRNMSDPNQQQRDMGVPPGTPPSAGGQNTLPDSPMTKHQEDTLKSPNGMGDHNGMGGAGMNKQGGPSGMGDKGSSNSSSGNN